MKIIPTRFDGYYVSEDGRVWTEFNRFSGKKESLRELNQFQRGGTDSKDRYLSVNISLKNESGKTIKQIRYYTHKLIAETLIENPNNLREIDHIDRNKQNNTIKNLRWVSRHENMSSWERDSSVREKISQSQKLRYKKLNN